MKKWYSKTNKTDSANKAKKSFLKSNNTYVVLFGLIFLFLLLVSVFSPETSSEESRSVANKSAAHQDRKLRNAENVEENIRNSYARLAAERANICPKLIQEEVGSRVIERSAEVMVGDYCDYFLYPRTGQYISVKLNDSRIEALLVVPRVHNFANGDYRVDSYDKHVIRLAYNGATYKPDDLVYDVEVTISK